MHCDSMILTARLPFGGNVVTMTKSPVASKLLWPKNGPEMVQKGIKGPKMVGMNGPEWPFSRYDPEKVGRSVKK